jgi:23S rRNA (guanosine2251-2'-O)-methyltransferase
MSSKRRSSDGAIGADIEGRHAVLAAVAAGRVRELLVERSRLRDEDINDAATLVRDGGGEVTEIRDAREFAKTTAPQGLIARCRPIPVSRVADLVEVATPAAVLVLDHLEDARNVGAIVRSAAAAGVRALVVPSDRSAPLGAAAFKAAAGMFEMMNIAVVSSVAQSLQRLQKAGLWVVALDGAGDRPIFDLDLLAEPVALVVGGEGRGIGRLVRERADVVAHIPMAEDVESLNASAAATLALFELMRQRSSAG